MGHFHSSNLDMLLLNAIYKNGYFSIDDAVALAQKRKRTVHTSEGNYDEKYMIQNGFETLFNIHYERHDIEPVSTNRKEKRALKRWLSGEIFDDDYFDENGESIGDLKVVDSIKFKFVEGQRKNYKIMLIDEIDS